MEGVEEELNRVKSPAGHGSIILVVVGNEDHWRAGGNGVSCHVRNRPTLMQEERGQKCRFAKVNG
jgi:hypothetical protein